MGKLLQQKNSMLVIHPKDRTTSVLSTLYEGMDANMISSNCSNKTMEHLLHHVSTQEQIMLLGHGSDKGLFYREDDTKDEFDKIIVGHSHAFHLRRHGSTIIGIWCHADKFARAEGLHGLFSGMIISEQSEADEYDIMATQEEICASNQTMFLKLRQLLDEKVPFCKIAERMKALDDENTPLSAFNYGNFYYL